VKRAERGNRGALALVSGGLDSTVSLALAVERGIAAAVLFFDYGQKARRAELSAARRLAAHYALPFELIDLPWLGRLSASALVEGGAPLPHPAAPDLRPPPSPRALRRDVALLAWPAPLEVPRPRDVPS